MNSYQRLKDFISTNLHKSPGALESNQINDEISNLQKLIQELGYDKIVRFFPDKSPLEEMLTDEDWVRMKKELESHFYVKMDKGNLIQGKEQRNRDITWWTSNKKQKCENNHWNRYKKYLSLMYSKEIIKTLDTDTDIILNNTEDPANDSFERYGMVVGHVQSGKTSNYSALICKAADAGYKFIVVIAGGINNLRNQTQSRLNESFVGKDKGIITGVGKIIDTSKEMLPVSLTTAESDFNKHDAEKNKQSISFEVIKTPILLVIKKNSNTLSNVIVWLESHYKNQIANHAMLMIDDESDYASINTKDKDDPTTINKKIRHLLSLFGKSTYVAYTATPYANIFIDHEAGRDDLGSDLFPKDFIYALESPSNYFGARTVFLESQNNHLVPIDDYVDYIPQNHKKDFSLVTLPPSLYDAVQLFLINIAIRWLRGQSGKHNSMLIHATRFTMVHQKIGMLVQEYIDNIKKELHVYGCLHDSLNHSKAIKEIYGTYCIHINPEWDWVRILKALCNIIDTVVVREVHQQRDRDLEYRNDFPTNAIVIGGTSLSRGFTLEGLNVSYFLRNTIFYDTLMQMGRWFGYRDGYDDLCKIYMPETTIDHFARIIDATDDLISDFKTMSEAKKTPYDFGLAVKQYPESVLQITARNKQKNVQEFVFSMQLDGRNKETSWLSSNPKDNCMNLDLINNLVLKIDNSHTRKNVSNHYLWQNVDKNNILEFVKNFKYYTQDTLGISSRMPIEFIKKYIQDRNTDWDIALYSGKSKKIQDIGEITIELPKRKVYSKNGYYELQNRAVSSGSDESIALDPRIRNILGSDRKKTRTQLSKPLLMLYILEATIFNSNKELFDEQILAAYGLSFPGDVNSNKETINLKINTVYAKYLIRDMKYDEMSEDECDD